MIPPTRVLIEYEADDGSTAMYAECPGCHAIIHPHPTNPRPADD